MSSLRIAILSPYPWPPREDVNVHISALAKALCVLGHRVTVFAPGSDPAALADGRARRDALAEGDHDAFVADGGRPLVVLVGRARAISTRAPIASARDAAGALEVILADSPFDVVDVHEALAPSPLLPALRHARGIVIATFHGMAPPVGVAFASPIVSRALANVDIRIVATRAAAAALNELLPERYDVVPPAASVVPAPPTAGGILIVARDRDRAGMRFALRAIRDAGAADHAITILGPGDAPWRTTAAVPTALRARVLTIADRGADSKRSAISGAELVLIPGEADTDVGVLDDALASGRTVLAVRTPLAEERMSSGLLAPFSTPDWAAAISTALAAPRRPAAPARRDWSDVATARLTLIRAAMVERRGAARAPTTVLADLDIRPGRAADVPALIAAAEARSIGVVALVVAGDLTAVAAAAAGCETAVHVVLGQSIRTGDGRLTALFLTHEIPAGRSLRETIALAAAQGGFVVAPHPDDPDAPDPAELFEAGRAIDAFALVRPERGRAGDETARVARAAGIRVVGGSGARRPTDVGRVCLALPPFRDADGLRGALRDARIVRRRRPVLTARTAVQRRGRHD